MNPELKSHQAHQHIAEKYGIHCTPRDMDDGCMEFPASSSPILRCITGMFKERAGSESGGMSSDGEAHSSLRGRSLSLSSSQSESDAVFRPQHHDSIPTNEFPTIDFVVDQVVNGLSQDFDSFQAQELDTQNDSKSLRRGDHQESHEAVTSLNEQFQTAERNDSGVGSDYYHQNDADAVDTVTTSQGNTSGQPTPPVVSVSSFHSRESSVDSQMSLGSHHSSLVGTLVESGLVRKSQDCAVGGRLGTKDLSRSSSQEVGIAGAHYDFKFKTF